MAGGRIGSLGSLREYREYPDGQRVSSADVEACCQECGSRDVLKVYREYPDLTRVFVEALNVCCNCSSEAGQRTLQEYRRYPDNTQVLVRDTGACCDCDEGEPGGQGKVCCPSLPDLACATLNVSSVPAYPWYCSDVWNGRKVNLRWYPDLWGNYGQPAGMGLSGPGYYGKAAVTIHHACVAPPRDYSSQINIWFRPCWTPQASLFICETTRAATGCGVCGNFGNGEVGIPRVTDPSESPNAYWICDPFSAFWKFSADQYGASGGFCVHPSVEWSIAIASGAC